MDITPVLPDLLAAARIGLDPGDAGLAVDPAGTRTFVVIDRGGRLDPELVTGLAGVIAGFGVPAVLLLRREGGRPSARDRSAWRELRELVDGRLLPDTLVVGDVEAWSLRHDRAVADPVATTGGPEAPAVPTARVPVTTSPARGGGRGSGGTTTRPD